MTDLVGCIAPEKLEEYRNVFVYLENRNGKISRGALEMLGKGKEISVKLNEKVVGIAIGQDLKAVADEAASFGCDLILGAELSDFNGFSSVAYTNIISDFIFEQKPNIFLISGSREGRDLVSRIAVKCKTGVAADCIELDGDPTNRLLIAWRPSFGDKTIDQILCRKHRPQMITSRPGSYKLPEKVEKPDCETRIKKVKVGKLVAKHKILEFKPKTRLDLTSSKIIVSGGLGIGGPKGFDPIRKLAKELEGEVGASRPVVDLGWIPYEHQVGQTGQTVRPKLYIAAGISGKIQHIVGMKASETIIAINTDPDAPIVKYSDYFINADAGKAVAKLADEIRKYKKAHLVEADSEQTA
ncbi:MAG: electron transfer flavoprotein subunit alpha/FixB family protein [Candidatus Thermoplasmatota archaeon]|nr:electron transfer flavoprotein subunit alpha/FixB family protein [Candidatus Thermoplasmatota archaeon]